jgi:hypothetical protein
MRKFWFLWILVVFTAVPAWAQDNVGHVRIAHFAPRTAAVDIYVDGEANVFQPIEYGSVSEWVELPVRAYGLSVVEVGSGLQDAIYHVADFTLVAGEWVTLAAIGVTGETNFPFVLQPIVENYTEIADGQMRLTFFHAIPNIGAVDVRVADGTVLAEALTYPGQAASLGISSELTANDGALTLPDLLAGVYTLQVTPTGSADVLLELANVELMAGHNYLVTFAGLASEAQVIVSATNTIQAEVTENTSGAQDLAVETCEGSGTVQVRFAHFAVVGPRVPALDFYLDGELFGDGLVFADISEWIEIDAANMDVAVVSAGAAIANAIIQGTGAPLCPDSWVTIAAIGFAETNTLAIQPIMEDFRPLPANTARLTVFHGIPNAPPVNVQLVGGNLLIGGLTYPGQAAALGISDEPSANDGTAVRTLDIGVYDLAITRQDVSYLPIISFEDLALERGKNYLLAIIGSLNQPTYSLADTVVPPRS